MNATSEALLKFARLEIEEMRARERIGAEAYRAMKARAEAAEARANALENDQHGVVAEASRQVAASDTLYRKMCGQRESLIVAGEAILDAGTDQTKLTVAIAQWALAKQGLSTGPTAAGLSGVLVRAGTFVASGEEVTGYVVASTIEELKAVPRLPMYRRVQITEATP